MKKFEKEETARKIKKWRLNDVECRRSLDQEPQEIFSFEGNDLHHEKRMDRILETAQIVLCMSLGHHIRNNETWWNENAQSRIKRKKQTKKVYISFQR